MQGAFQNDQMLILVLVDMHWRTVPRIRNQLKRRKGPLRPLDGGADFETFSRRCLQPFTIAVMPVRQNSVVISDAVILISLFRHVKAHRCVALFVFISYRSAKENSILGSKFMDIPNGHGRWLSWSNRVGRCRDRRRFQESLEAGRRKHEEIVVFGVARITQLVGDVARSDREYRPA